MPTCSTIVLSLSLPRFLCKHADAELQLLLTESVPPVDINRIGIFRAVASKHAKEAWNQNWTLQTKSVTLNFGADFLAGGKWEGQNCWGVPCPYHPCHHTPMDMLKILAEAGRAIGECYHSTNRVQDARRSGECGGLYDRVSAMGQSTGWIPRFISQKTLGNWSVSQGLNIDF